MKNLEYLVITHEPLVDLFEVLDHLLENRVEFLSCMYCFPFWHFYNGGCLFLISYYRFSSFLGEAEAVTKRITRRPGESLQVKCPSLTVGEVRATSFVKQKGDVYVTLFSKLARNPIKKVPNTATHATLDETKRIMTVSKLSMKDDGMTFSCKLVSLHQELTNSVHVTIVGQF